MGLFNRSKKNKIFSALETDMHCHLLPGVDDGCRDVDETIECLRVMGSLGYKKVFLTPHFQANYPNKEEYIQKHFNWLKEELKRKTDEELPELAWISGEYRFDVRYARKAGIDQVLPLPGNRLLCEFALHANDFMSFDLLEGFQKQGYNLILAHPERYPYLGVHSPDIDKLRNMGVELQINILSLNGFYGDAAMDKGFAYIEQGWVNYLGTDMHNIRYANELIATAKNKRVRKMLQNYTFKNAEL